jgi:hypothetical protein
MENWYLIALVDLVLLGILRLLFRSTHHPHHAPGEGLAAHRLLGRAVR